MKILKYLTVLLVVLAIAAAVIIHKRESIVRDFANPMLREYGLTIAEISIDTLTGSLVVLSRLELVQDDGARYLLRDVSFPLTFPSFRAEVITIGEVVVRPAPADGQPTPISGLLQTFLDLPRAVPNTAVILSRLEIPELPVLHNIEWRTGMHGQHLALDAEGLFVSLAIEVSDGAGHSVLVSIAAGDGDRAGELPLLVSRQASGFVIEGSPSISLVSWVPFLRAIGLLPQELVALDTDLGGPVSVFVDDDAAQPIRMSAEFSLGGARTAVFRSGNSDIRLHLQEAAGVQVQMEYPSVEWTIAVPQSRVRITADDLADAEGRLNDLSCQSGVRCSMNVAFEKISLRIGDAAASGATISTGLSIAIGDDSVFDFSPGAAMTFKDVSSGDWRAGPVSVSAVNGGRLIVSENGWAVELERLNLNAASLSNGDMDAANVLLSTSFKATANDDIRIDITPNSKVTVSDLTSGDRVASSITATASKGSRLQSDEKGWRMDTDVLEVALNGLSNGHGLSASLPLSLSNVRIRDNASIISLAFSLPAKAASIGWHGTTIAGPGASGTVSLRNESLSTNFELSAERNAASASIAAIHGLNSGQGSLTVRDGALRFGQKKLSGWLAKWPYSWDLVAGNGIASADLEWKPAADGTTGVGGTASLRVETLAGFYNDIVFTGLNTGLSAAIDDDVRIAPAAATLDLLDVGVPIRDLAADFAFDVPGRLLDVRKLTMATLGGTIQADPFRFDMQDTQNDIMLRPHSVQLQFMVDLAEFDDIELTGSISGRIPVKISEKIITVTDGRLESDAPGVIRYKAGAASAINNELSLVSRALNNFQFDSLTSDVNYTEAGDLKLKMRLSGINPDMDARQPIILNLGVENNIPQLLRSLQATRAIEDILQKRRPN